MLSQLRAGDHGHAAGWCRCCQPSKSCRCGLPASRWSPPSTAFTTCGQLFIYTRTPQQNARTIWGRYFPGFTEHERRLHDEAVLRDAVRRTGGLTLVAAQTFQHPRTSTAGRLRAQAEGRHCSTFSLYPPEELRAAIATFLARLPGPEVCWVDKHLLVVVAGRRRNQAEPGGSSSRGPGDQGSGPPGQRRARR